MASLVLRRTAKRPFGAATQGKQTAYVALHVWPVGQTVVPAVQASRQTL